MKKSISIERKIPFSLKAMDLPKNIETNQGIPKHNYKLII